MIHKSIALILATALIVPALAVPADAAKKRHKRIAKHAHVAAPHGYRQEPARMIEIRPGYWISSWGCFTDEGYGRIAGCEGRDSAD
jgi:hypothetical protein